MLDYSTAEIQPKSNNNFSKQFYIYIYVYIYILILNTWIINHIFVTLVAKSKFLNVCPGQDSWILGSLLFWISYLKICYYGLRLYSVLCSMGCIGISTHFMPFEVSAILAIPISSSASLDRYIDMTS